MRNVFIPVAHKAHEAIWYLCLVAGIILAKEFLKASVLQVIIGISVIVVLYVIYLFVDEFRGRMVVKKLPWLYSTGATGIGRPLGDVERNVEAGSTIYLVTPDLYNDARNRETIDVVTSNLKREVTYRYLTLNDEPQARRNIDVVQHNFATFNDQVEIYAINEMFGLIPTYNILVLERDAVGILRAFVELPVKDHSDSRSLRHLWVEADAEFGGRWHGRILAVLKDVQPLANPFSNPSKAETNSQ